MEKPEKNPGSREDRGDAIFAEKRNSLHLHCGCGHRGAGAQLGAESGEFGGPAQRYEACWTPQQLESHMAAGRAIDRIVREGFQRAGEHVRNKQPITEYDLQQCILREFEPEGIMTENGPDIGVNAHASDPHYCPLPGKSSPIREGDFLLLDVWGKKQFPAASTTT